VSNRTLASAIGASALVACLLFGAAASACTGAQFAARRKQLRADGNITFGQVEAQPFAYVGKVLELRGTVGGSVTTDGHLCVMLNMADSKAVMLEIPDAEAEGIRDLSTPNIRALVQVQDGANGNVVPLKTLAVAYEVAIAADEKLQQAKADAARKRSDWKKREQDRWQATMDRAVHHRPASISEPSRGDYQRPPAVIPLIGAPGGLTARAQPLYNAYYAFIARRNSRLTAVQVSQITFHLLNFADRFNVDPRLVVAMIIAESDFNPMSTSRTGAKGLGQLMPGTARGLGVNNPYDIVQNLGGSVNYLRSQLDTFGRGDATGGYSFDQVALAMAAYNAGENAVKRYHGVPPYRETQAYVKRVTSLYQQLCR